MGITVAAATGAVGIRNEKTPKVRIYDIYKVVLCRVGVRSAGYEIPCRTYMTIVYQYESLTEVTESVG